MNDLAQYIVLLAVSVGLTFLVGRLLVTAGEPFLQDVFQDRSVSRSVNLLLSVLFHLITLGVLAIISVVDLGGLDEQPVQAFVLRLGVVLLVLGSAYGISMLVLIRIRERRRAAQISEHVQERLADRAVDPRGVVDTRGVDPRSDDPRSGQITTRPVAPDQP